MTEAAPRKKRRKREIHKLGEFKLIGFSMANALPGDEQVPVLTKAALLSDDHFFHHCMRAFAQDIDAKLREQNISKYLGHASNFLVLIDPDFSATLYVDCIDYSLEMISKRAVQKGEAVWSNDIGDIYNGSINFPKIGSNQHFILCLRHGWKFLLIFDLTPETKIDLEAINRAIGLGMRRLLFEQLYQTMADERILGAMIRSGWFPFNELIGAEFDDLRTAIANDFNIEAVESALVANFTAERLALLLERWWSNPQFETRRALLSEGVQLFSEGRHIASIKTLLTEIEGILRERHVPSKPGRQGIDKVLSAAFEEVLTFAGADSIYFPEKFVDYLNSTVFSHFDPQQAATEATRNTVSHGRAPAEVYTSVRALQTILVLDQINRFITLPKRPTRLDRSAKFKPANS
jgi:hypothetical protein